MTKHIPFSRSTLRTLYSKTKEEEERARFENTVTLIYNGVIRIAKSRTNEQTYMYHIVSNDTFYTEQRVRQLIVKLKTLFPGCIVNRTPWEPHGCYIVLDWT